LWLSDGLGWHRKLLVYRTHAVNPVSVVPLTPPGLQQSKILPLLCISSSGNHMHRVVVGLHRVHVASHTCANSNHGNPLDGLLGDLAYRSDNRIDRHHPLPIHRIMVGQTPAAHENLCCPMCRKIPFSHADFVKNFDLPTGCLVDAATSCELAWDPQRFWIVWGPPQDHVRLSRRTCRCLSEMLGTTPHVAFMLVATSGPQQQNMNMPAADLCAT
jgi:hypothetical protein